jgi:hypothetical protein
MPYGRRSDGFRLREARRVTQANKKLEALKKVQVGNIELGDLKSFLNDVSPFSRAGRDAVRALHGKYVAGQNAQPVAE